MTITDTSSSLMRDSLLYDSSSADDTINWCTNDVGNDTVDPMPVAGSGGSSKAHLEHCLVYN